MPNPRVVQSGVSHYPLEEGQVIIRWRNGQTADEAGYIVEANVGGVIMRGAGHYGDSLHNAREAGERIASAITVARASTERGADA